VQARDPAVKQKNSDFLAGVIEGFYGPPWSQPERLELLEWMAGWGLNTYVYAPKDDLKHRVIWRELYTDGECNQLRSLVCACEERNIQFVYGIGPGLDIRYSDQADLDCLQRRLSQIEGLGARHFALLFDDIPDHLDGQDLKRWGSLAAAQCHVANTIMRRQQERHPGARLLFCPTAYCGRMAERSLGGNDYLAVLGRELLPEIDIFWTGPEIISREITVAHVQEVEKLLRRKPLIWDNLHANDYDGRRFYCGPYAGRPLELRGAVRGILSNPNCEFPLNYAPLRTLAEFLRSESYESRQAYKSAMREWLPQFATVGQPITLEDLILFGDCYYLPYEEGPEADQFYEHARELLAKDSGKWGAEAVLFRQKAVRLRAVCARMTELKNRPLFHALSRRLWELREEVDLLERYLEFKGSRETGAGPFGSDCHLPGAYRGGMAARLQQLLALQPDGTFVPAIGTASESKPAKE
jgi:protein O-GlcNAcase / histone acetyltransferase